jgi:three-Cys-motif partner protein
LAKNYGRELWDTLVTQVRKDDLPVSFTSKGEWTAHKLFFVCNYLEQVARGMKNHSKFPGGLCYIDLFCGAGSSAAPVDGIERKFPGSPVIAASIPNGFETLILVDSSSDAIDSVSNRIESTGYNGAIHLFCDDCNVAIDDVVRHIPTRSLSIAFIDPFSLDIHYDTIRKLAYDRPMDLIILFSDRFDIGRNVHKYYYPSEEETKLDRMLGGMDWRSRFDKLDAQDGPGVRQFFAEEYVKKLSLLGYTHTRHWPLKGPGGDAFRLVYASKHELGLKFCDIALREDLGGSRGLFSPT